MGVVREVAEGGGIMSASSKVGTGFRVARRGLLPEEVRFIAAAFDTAATGLATCMGPDGASNVRSCMLSTDRRGTVGERVRGVVGTDDAGEEESPSSLAKAFARCDWLEDFARVRP